MRFLYTLAGLACGAAAAWLPPRHPGVQLIAEKPGSWKTVSTLSGEYTLESAQQYPAQAGGSFQVDLSIRVGLDTRALPELACYDSAGREIPVASSLSTGPDFSTTNWQRLRRVFPVQPGTATVRARVRASGRGEVQMADLEFRPRKIEAYQTGALIGQLYPNRRRGLVLESNRGIVNSERVTELDRDGDNRWALVSVDLDEISQPEQAGEDWRTRFEYRPNEIYWSDGAVLKSDSVLHDREPDIGRALHFRTRVFPGAYRAILNDPGRAVAISLDGKSWRRFPGGAEAELGRIQAGGGSLEFWVDACYRDPVSAGPVYFDYVRLFPEDDAPSVTRLFSAAQQKPAQLARGTAEEQSVAVSVDAARVSHWPVRSGIPIPPGELASAGHVAVFTPGGTPVPSQSRTMATWPDGSVKWLYVDFLGTPDEGYTIRYGNRVRPASAPGAVQIQSTTAGLEVNTGAVRFLVPRSRFGIIEDVRLPGGRVLQHEPLSAEIAETGGKTWRALDLPVETLEVEQPGPLHAVILVQTKVPASGQPAEGFVHRARIHIYAGSPLIQVDYFVANSDSRNTPRPGWIGSKLDVRSIALKLKPAIPLTETGVRVQKDARSPGDGWAAFRTTDGPSIWIGIEAFREQFPKALRWRPGEIELALWAEEGGDYEWNEGVGKTHRLSFYYSETPPSDPALLARGPLLAVAEPAWYVASGAFGPVITAAASRRPAIEKTLAAAMRGVVERVGVGFENFGDHSSPGYVKGTVAWANNEYDQPAAAINHFARTGDREALRLGLASALHFLDTDICHFSSRRAEWAGAARVHGHGIIGHHTAEAPNMHHAGDVQGLILYSYLTGEPIGIAGAEGVARWVLAHVNPASNVGSMERALGHPLMTLVDVYEATWNDAYLRGAARLVDWAFKWEHPDRSGYLAPVTESPGFYSGSPFCGGLLPSGLLKFNSWARLPELDRMLERVARWTITEMWRPPANIIHKGGPRRASAGAQPRHISNHLRLMSHAFATTRDPLFLVVPALSVEQAFGAGAAPFGYRNSGLVYNYLPYFLRTWVETGNPDVESLSVAPPPEVLVRQGEAARACFVLKPAAAIEDLRVSFQTRLEFASRPLAPPPRSLAAGARHELCFEITAPQWLNLTSENNRIAYGHLSALYQRAGMSRMAHAVARITVSQQTRGSD